MERDRIIKIKDMITRIKDKQVLKEIFYIAQNDLQSDLQSSDGECKYSHNDNGIFFDLKLLSKETLLKIEELLKTTISSNNTDSDTTSVNIIWNNYNDNS
jgi:hypothetical protein